jgi:hypothetical protein
MTDKIDVAGLRALLEKATPGPWESRIEPQRYPECDDVDLPVTISGNSQHIAWLNERYDADLNQVNDVDAALITAAVNALPALLDAAEATAALEGEVQRLRQVLSGIAESERSAGIYDVLGNSHLARAALSERPQ